jgi:C4-dicarboxylate transporter, DctM subunit
MGIVGIVSEKVNLVGAFLSGVSILSMGLIVTYEVIMRFIFGAPTMWVSEISMLLCTGCVFTAVGYAMKEKAHISVDLITGKLSGRNQTVFSLIGLSLSVIYCLFLTWKGMDVAIATYLAGETAPTGLGIPAFIPRMFVPIGGGLLLLEVISQILSRLSDLRSEKPKAESEAGPWVRRNLPVMAFLGLLVICGTMLLFRSSAPSGLFILLFVLIFGGTPIAIALGLLGLAGFGLIFGGGPMLDHVPMVSFSAISDFIIVAIPLYIIVSSVLGIGGVGSNLFDVASKWVGHLPGGLGVSTIVACAVFAAISGSATATVLAIGIIAIPAMLSKGYDRKFVYGTVAMGGVLGPLIPPSLFMILIGAITGDSIGKLFMAGMFPGIMLAAVFSVYIVLNSLRNKRSMPKIDPVPFKERWESLRKAILGLFAPVIILGGIYSGIFTPTEAAAVGMSYGLFVCVFLTRTIKWKELYQIILEGAKLTSLVLFIFTGAMLLGQVVALLKFPETMVVFLSSLPLSPMTILFLVLIFILILGALMDEASILLITYPILHQIFVKHFGFDSIWFAMVFVFTLEVGLVAPPVGINLFVVQGIDKTAKFEEVVRGVLPFTLLMIASILIVVYFKPLSTWLPRVIG